VVVWAAAFAGVALWCTRHGSALTPDSTDYAEVARSLVRGNGDTINRVIFNVGLMSKIRHTLEVHGMLSPWLLAPMFAIRGAHGGLVRIPGISVRNHRVYGSFGSPYGALEWLGKEKFAAYFAFYPEAPTVGEFFAERGASKVAALVGHELSALFDMFVGDPLLIAGLLGAFWLRRSAPMLARLASVYALVIVFVVCVLHHVEVRYFSAFLPLAAVSVAAALGALEARLVTLLSEERARSLRLALSIGLAGFAVAAFVRSTRDFDELGAHMKQPGPCEDAMRALEASAAPDEAVLTSNPWLVSWRADRPAVNAPTNGAEPLLTVAEHYDVKWALDGGAVVGGLDVGAALRDPEVEEALQPELTFEGPACSIYRLHPRWQ
jgi:hypothetical protein